MTSSNETHRRTWPRRIFLTTLGLILAATTLAGVVVAGSVSTGRAIHRPAPATSGGVTASTQYAEPGGPTDLSMTAGASHPNLDDRLVVAFVVGTHGTIASDLLAPYDIIASSPAFTTYVVADHMGPATLEGAPAVMPTYTFDQVDADPALEPDLVVVPGLTEPTGPAEAPLRRWVARQHDDGAKVMSVCSGAMVLAATGMLDGVEATSHWSRISALETSRPAVHWVRGRRYVEDDSVTTTAAVTSGVPGALHLVAELAGAAEAQRVANLHPEFHWTSTTSTRIPKDHFAVGDWPVGLNFVMPWLRATVGVALPDGVGELDATAAFEVYGQSAAAGTMALGTAATVRTRHGLTMFTTTYADARGLSRVVVPGAASSQMIDPQVRAWARRRQLPLEPLGGGFRAALQNLAHHTDHATAYSTAKMIGYPTAALDLGRQHRSYRAVVLAASSLILAVLLGMAPARLASRRRRRRLASDAPAATSLRESEEVETVLQH